ncbi:MAG: DNA translocase FtsK, partial [Chloroflexi bacterium]|nr:DNA translocase FtsK [Chloroflexota bacterium]
MFNQVGVLLVLIVAALVAYVIIGQPAWAIDPLRGAASDILGGLGVGLVLLLALASWLGWLASRGLRFLIRQWRYVFGLAFLMAGALAFLSYFHTGFPLIGTAPLGGDLGGQIRGTYGAPGVLRTAVLVTLGAWLIAPVFFNHAALWIGRGTVATGRGIGSGVSRMRRREGSALQEVDDYLTSSATASRAAQMEALLAADDYRRRTAAQSVVTRSAPAPRGLAYLEPTSPKPIVSRPSEPEARPERKPDLWPGLRSNEPAAAELQPNAATATMAPPLTQSEPYSEPMRVAPPDAVEEQPAPEQTHIPEETYVNGTLHADVEETLALAIPVEIPWGEITVTPEPSALEPEAPRAAAPLPDLLPPLELLAAPVAAGSITEEHLTTAALIEETLAQHGVEVSVSEIRPGPSVTMFGIVPGWNRKAMSARARALAAQEDNQVQMEVRNRVKVDSILAREKDLALALAAPTLRIQAPVPGESLVGVEMPNKSSSMVTIRTVMESPEYERMLAAGGLPVALGLASAGEPVALDLLKMPHLLIAGATGSGKSVCINTIISSIICHQDPAKVRMLLVDPKRVELTPYNGIPHLLTPVVVDPDRVVRLLKGAIQEMMRRYKLLEEAGARNIVSYNSNPRATEEMPYFVICIDELADLMMTASFDVEQSLCRLAQLGRATGIHLIVATQRPSVDVLTGLIKA